MCVFVFVCVLFTQLSSCDCSMGKESEANHKEYAQQLARIEKMKTANDDPYNIKKQVIVCVLLFVCCCLCVAVIIVCLLAAAAAAVLGSHPVV